MKKIYHLYKTFQPFTYGGVEGYIESIISSKSSFNHYLLSIGDDKYNNKQKKIFKKNLSYSSDVISLKLFKYLLKNINKDKDLIHLHSPWPSMEIFLLICGFKNLIITYHSDIVRQKYINFFYKPINIFFLNNNVKKIVVTSKKYFETSDLLRKISNKKVKVIPIGISNAPYSPNINKDTRDNHIIFIGSNRSYKGIKLLDKVISSSNQKFVCIGSNLSSLRHNKNLKIYENIDESLKIKLLSEASFMLMTSISRNEAFGIVLLEALRSGLPIISPNLNSGVSWVNKNKITGYIYKTKSYDDIINKIFKINNLTSKKYIELKSNARKRYESNFTLEIMNKELNIVYNEYFNL